MAAVEVRFHRNLGLAVGSAAHTVNVQIHKHPSAVALPSLLAQLGPGYFDWVYVDGSHQAADVLFDAVLSLQLLRVGGVMVFDDYLWNGVHAGGLLDSPKIAIDAFTNVHADKIRVLPAPLYQLYIVKTRD